MTNTNRIVPLKNNKKSPLMIAEESISRHETKEALRAATYAYEQRLQALLAEVASKEENLEIEYLAEMARIIGG